MEIRIDSIKRTKEYLKKNYSYNIRAILVSSFDDDIEMIPEENKLLLKFDDVTSIKLNSFTTEMAKKIHRFVNEINFEKNKLYVCCDSGESRSSAIAACILRKYKQDENIIWKDCNYHPNILVYDILCQELGMKNTVFRLKYKMYINNKALNKKINISRRICNK